MGRGWVNAVREAAGAAKGRLFTKIAREIAVATRIGGAAPESNSRLRSALLEARKNSMPKDTIERAIRRGTGEGSDAVYEEVLYEGYGPHGVACLVEALTDNRNRTVQDLRAAIVRGGGNLGESGSTSWMFERKGMILARAPKAGLDPEEAAIVAGADEVLPDVGPLDFCFWTALGAMDVVAAALTQSGWDLLRTEASYKPKTPKELTESEEKDLQKFVELVSDSDDIKRVYLAAL